MKHTILEKPGDVVAARRERQKRKDLLRKEVSHALHARSQHHTALDLCKKHMKTIEIVSKTPHTRAGGGHGDGSEKAW